MVTDTLLRSVTYGPRSRGDHRGRKSFLYPHEVSYDDWFTGEN